jgi:STE24 endopeptidase
MKSRRIFAGCVVLFAFLPLLFAAPAARCAMLHQGSLTQTAPPAEPQQAQPNPAPPTSVSAQETQKLVTSYTLPPDKYAKSRHLNRIGYVVRFFAPLYGILVLALILHWGWSAKFRDWAESLSKRRLVQGAIYAAILLFVLGLAQLPIAAWQHWMFRRYDLVTQGWGSWLGDHAKSQLVTTIIGVVAIWVLFAAIRKSPRRWWLYFWLVMLPFAIFLVFISPIVIDPLFNKFEPLQSHDPALVDSLERVVTRVGLRIPPDRMFWMNASAKEKFVNAYVTGIGASKRVVVWDTTIKNMSNAQILFVFGHEMGHYVLGHIPKGFAFYALLFFLLFYLVYRLSGAILQRKGASWEIRGPDDWAAFPILMACLLLLLFIGTPMTNAVSRYYEHQADQYGLEVTHGITPDSAQVAAQSFQILGEIDMEDPAPTRLEIWWYWNHPWIGDRIKFALEYDPWSKGEAPEFVK